MCPQSELKKKSIARSVLAVGLQVLLWLQVILSVFRGFKCSRGSRGEGADASILGQTKALLQSALADKRWQ